MEGGLQPARRLTSASSRQEDGGKNRNTDRAQRHAPRTHFHDELLVDWSSATWLQTRMGARANSAHIVRLSRRRSRASPRCAGATSIGSLAIATLLQNAALSRGQ